jgi:glycosidase
MGADGFRLDAARHYIEDGRVQAHTPATHDWLRAFYLFSKGLNPEMLAVGEVWDVSDVVATYVGDQLDLVFEFSLATAILLSVNEGRVTPLESGMKEIQRLYPEDGYATFLTNHDQDRVMDELGREPDKARLAATVLMTLPGVPFVYYGEEIGMTGSKPDELIRTPMQWSSAAQAGFSSVTPWEPVNDGYEETNVERQTTDSDSLLSHYRELITLRSGHLALSNGGFFPLQSADRSVYSFVRYTPDERVLVVINLGDQPTADYALAAGTSPLTAGVYTASALPGGMEAVPLDVGPDGAFLGYQPQPELPPRSALILFLAPVEE